MLVQLGMWIVGVAIVALALECVGAAAFLFVVAALLIRHAS